MPANIDTLLYVGEKPWQGLGINYDKNPKTAEDIVKGTALDWTVSAHVLHSDLNEERDVHAIYRDDNNFRLGVVQTRYPKVVQNSDTFIAVEPKLENDLTVETAASTNRGKTVFGCFRLNSDDSVLDDKIETYFVIINDHTRADGKVTVINTPIRVACQNALSAALNAATLKVRIPITDDPGINHNIMNTIFDMHRSGIQVLRDKADTWAKRKLTQDNMTKIMDELFPYPEPDDIYSEKNRKMEMKRSTFLEKCMQAENLNNYRGTVYQVFNALTDYTQHFMANPDKTFDLQYRMNTLPGIGIDSPATMVNKFIKMQDKLFVA